MELFDEIYSRNYTAIAKILKQFQSENRPMTGKEISDILTRYNAELTLRELTDNLGILTKSDHANTYIVRDAFLPAPRRPLTFSELSWLRAVSLDRRLSLFLDDEQRDRLTDVLADVPTLYDEDMFCCFDEDICPDDYNSKTYQAVFRKLRKAIRRREYCLISCIDRGDEATTVLPVRLCYSQRDGSFTMYAQDEDEREITVPLRQILFVKLLNSFAGPVKQSAVDKASVTIRILSDADPEAERNAVERFMISFSDYQKETRYLSDAGICETTVYFRFEEYENILQTIIAFGPVVKIIQPQSAVKELVMRLKRQKELLSNREH